ncbi:MAG: hypothetical protein LBI45_08170 [Bacteroidales bacterium]|jgi:hypothetical protein|nr:hypothetical protein [Bacteroidales bacterium]
MKLKIIITASILFFVSCVPYKDDLHLTHIEVTNSLFDDKCTIYLECEIFTDSIVEITYLENCIVPINQFWKNTNYTNKKTIDKIYDEIIYKYNFKIYRTIDGEKSYFSFNKFRTKHPNDCATFDRRIENVVYVHYDIFAEKEYFLND